MKKENKSSIEKDNDNYRILSVVIKSEIVESIEEIVNSGVRSKSEIVELFLDYGIKNFGAAVKNKIAVMDREINDTLHS